MREDVEKALVEIKTAQSKLGKLIEDFNKKWEGMWLCKLDMDIHEGLCCDNNGYSIVDLHYEHEEEEAAIEILGAAGKKFIYDEESGIELIRKIDSDAVDKIMS